MVAYTKSQLFRLLKIDFVRFCIVGGTGFFINFIILILSTKLFHAPVFVAQLIGAEIALFSNFILHNHWTYKANKVEKTLTKLVLQFHITSWPAILGSTAMVSLGVDVFHFTKLLALVISSTIALLWNFIWSKYVIWRDMASVQKIERSIE